MAPIVELAARVGAVDLLVVPVFAGRVAGPGADLLDGALDGGLAAFMEEAGFDGSLGEHLAVPTGGRLSARAAILLGVGPRDGCGTDAMRRVGAALARKSGRAATVVTTLLDARSPETDPAAAAQALAEGIVLGAYRFTRYRAAAKPSALKRVRVVHRATAGLRAAVARGVRVGEAVCLARDLVNEPAEAKSPDAVARIARRVGRQSGLKVQVLSGEQLVSERMGGVLGVGGGSDRPPRFVRLEWSPPRARGTLALVGKGVVFDSGGLSLKTATGMETMKTDMAGAAAVIAAMSTLRDLGVKTRVVGYVPLVENMPSGRAVRPGDVLTMRNGTTVEVLNTDAEGRLILADALAYAVDEKPDAIIDLATLTGAVTMALGERIAGLMGMNDGWVEAVTAAAGRAGERVWRLPLPEDYKRVMESEIADLRNTATGGGAGTITAGLFLRDFTGGLPWVHLDIAGTARASADDGEIAKGGTGFGVRTLVELARTFAAPTR